MNEKERSLKDDPPKKGQSILVWDNSKASDRGWSQHVQGDYELDSDYTHWLPAPPPPPSDAWNQWLESLERQAADFGSNYKIGDTWFTYERLKEIIQSWEQSKVIKQ